MTSWNRLVVTLAAGLALVGAVAVLRGTADVQAVDAPAPPAPPPSVTDFAAPGVTVADVAGPAGTPDSPEFVPGEDLLVLRWTPVPTATGYDVRWRAGEHRERRRLTAVPAVALPGVPDGTPVSVSVSSVDALGRRSLPLRVTSGDVAGRLERPGPRAFADGFSSVAAPDRTRWRLPEGADRCLSRGGGSERGLLVVSHRCGTVELRPSAPFTRDAAGRGRMVLVADGPAPGGEVVLALVAGPAPGLPPDALERPAPPPGTVTVDPLLPPDTVLVRIGAGGPALVLGVGATTAGAPPAPVEPAVAGVPTRWELETTAEELRVLRDGEPVLATPTVPPWRQATAVLAVAPADGDEQGRTVLDAVRLSTTGPVSETARVLTAGPAGFPAADITDATALRLRAWWPGTPAPGATVALGDGPAVPLWAGPPGATHTAVTADLPVPVGATGTVPVRLEAGAEPAGADVEPAGAVLEVIRPPEPALAVGIRLTLGTPPPPPVPVPVLRVLGPAGVPIDPAQPLPGPVTLEITADPGAAGVVGGYVGFEVDLDDRRILGLPTDDAVGGVYRVRLDPAALGSAPGPVALEMRLVPADPAVAPRTASVTLLMP